MQQLLLCIGFLLLGKLAIGAESPLELYNLKSDAVERHDVAEHNAELVAKAERLLSQARVENESFP